MADANAHDALVERLRLAQEIVDRAQLSDDLRPVGFTETIRALGGDHPGVEGEDTSKQDDHQREARRRDRSVLSERLAAVSEELQIDASAVAKAFADQNEQLMIIVPSRRFSDKTRGALRQIAILVTCARQAGGWDTLWTTGATIRNECVRLGFDTNNLGPVLNQLDEFSSQGTGTNRQLRANDESYKSAREVLRELGVTGTNGDSE